METPPSGYKRAKELLTHVSEKRHRPCIDQFDTRRFKNSFDQSDFEYNQYVKSGAAGFNLLLKLEFRNHVRMVNPVVFVVTDRTMTLSDAWWARFTCAAQREQAIEHLPEMKLSITGLVGFIRDYVDFLCFKLRYQKGCNSDRELKGATLEYDMQIRAANAELLRLAPSYRIWLDDILRLNCYQGDPSDSVNLDDPSVIITQFLNKYFVAEKDGECLFSYIYDVLLKHIEEEKLPPISKKVLGQHLNQKFQRVKKSEVYYKGIRHYRDSGCLL